MPLDKTCGGEFVDQGAVHFLVEIEVEAVERPVRVAEASLFVSRLEEPILAALHLVGDKRRDEVKWRELFGPRGVDANVATDVDERRSAPEKGLEDRRQ